MAVTITAAAIAAAIRLGDSAEETAEVTRLLEFATETVQRYAAEAPTVAQNEACVRLVGYLFDQPFTSRDGAFSNSMRNSGAGRLLLPWRIHRAGSTAEAVAAAQAAVGSADNPVTDVTTDAVAGTLTVTFADGTSRTDTLPAGAGGVDATARAAAAAAQATADTKDDAYPWATEGNDDIHVPEDKLTNAHDIVARANAQSALDTSAANARKLMPPSPAEAANGTATAIRGWTAALISTLVDARVALEAAPAPSGGGIGHWYEMGQLLLNPVVAEVAGNMTLRSDGLGQFADAAAVRTAVGDGSIAMIMLQRSDSDAQVPAAIAPNFTSSAGANYAIQFVFPNSDRATVRFKTTGIEITPHFAKASTVRFDLAVFA